MTVKTLSEDDLEGFLYFSVSVPLSSEYCDIHNSCKHYNLLFVNSTSGFVFATVPDAFFEEVV